MGKNQHDQAAIFGVSLMRRGACPRIESGRRGALRRARLECCGWPGRAAAGGAETAL